MSDSDPIALAERFGARNYAPLPVVIARAEGEYVWDPAGRRYLDFLSAYGAVNQGHRHPRIMAALAEQAARVTLTSRAFHNDRLGAWLEAVHDVSGLPKALPMNTGAEAVETAIKLARKWGYRSGRARPDRAEIVVCDGNFHGRTTTIVGFSSEEQYRDGFGPFTPGFRRIPYGDVAALEAAIGEDTVAFLVEPIQAEAGVRVPPDGWLARASALCRSRGVLVMTDEIQTGLGRTGQMFCAEHEGVKPDVLILGKSLGGGVLPVSAV
ncbi:MAG TPA: aminotransferase class III-fold pyridoxal phosphate-dependent enzyme, partial [bacterium]|nr:aminotransferase class III-fold pyridoxal phosphate-dependent enzyme [bacterium]